MNDPYKLLGVPKDADEETVKRAYLELVRKYHPDKYAGTDLADMATEKMKEINAAYEEILAERKKYTGSNSAGQAEGDYAPHSQYSYTNYREPGDDPHASLYTTVRIHINAGRMNSATVLLTSVPAAEREGEWYFLMGCVLIRRGQLLDAHAYLTEACRRNPENAEYRTMESRLRAQMERGDTAFGSRDRESAGTGDNSCSPCSPFFWFYLCCC